MSINMMVGNYIVRDGYKLTLVKFNLAGTDQSRSMNRDALRVGVVSINCIYAGKPDAQELEWAGEFCGMLGARVSSAERYANGARNLFLRVGREPLASYFIRVRK